MPRRARLDAPGTLHHVTVRGIEKCRIVNDVADRKNFLNRLGELSAGTKTRYQLPVKKDDQKLDEYIAQMCESKNVSIAELKTGSRRREVSRVRAQVATGLVKRHGIPLAEVARRVGVSTSAISKIINRENQ
jgi:hypothetical protein